MNILFIISIFFSVFLGFAITCFIFAVILSRSNDIGNSTGMVEDYKIDISFDADKRGDHALYCDWYFEEIAPDPNEPDPEKLVEPPVKHFELEDITAIYVDG